ncbi:hypothetical protein BJ508DRAFT_127463 [Ascobolus immersus RN42]|uniref:Uncharacterized protein n=1 Tax=Ascobolus immersus RN42 TaxID=1160509 RepID=A0A3N4I3J1_ASCIM|nr:hypothetical protein BJ508DRAFT_127463 [Ascobolus immersus RN42]
MSQRTVYPSYDARPSTRNGTGSSLDLGSRTVSRFSLLTRTRESSTSYFGKRSSAPDLVGNPTTLDDTPEEQSAHGGSRRSDSPNPKKGRPWKRAVTFSLSSSGSKKTSDYPDESYFASKETIPLEGSTDDPSGRITYRKTPHPSPLPTRHMFFWGKRKRESFLQSLLPTKLKEKSRRSEDSASQSPSSHFNSLPILQKVSSHDDDDPTPLPKAQGQTSQTSRTVSPLSSRKTSQQFSRSHSLRLARPVSPLESVRSAEDDESPESPGPSTSAPPPSPWVLVPPPIWRAMKEEGSFVFRKKKHSESQSSLGQDPPPVLEISLGQSFTVSQVDLLLSERQGSPRNSSELAEDMRLRSDANSIGKGGFFRRRKPSFQVIIPRIQEAFTRRASNWSLSSSGRGSKMRRESTPISSEGEEVLSGKEEEEEKPLGSRRMSW